MIAVGLSSGCLVRRRKIDNVARPGAPLRTANLDQLTELLRQRFQALETLNATVDLEPAILSPAKGEIAEYKEVRGYILIRKPAWIRVIALYPVLRGTAVDMVSDGENFRLHLPAKNMFLMGLNRIDKPSPKKLENLRPQHLLEALLVRPPEPGGEQVLLENWSDGGNPSYILHIIRRDNAGRLQLARKVWFDRRTLEIARQQLYDGGGEMVTDARYLEWERRPGSSFPRQISVSRPKDEYEMNIRFRKTVFNEPLEPDRFELRPPPGAKVQRLGEEPAGGRQPASGSGGGG